MGMSLASLLYPVIKPLLFRLDAEAAHELTTRMMGVTHSLGLLGREAIADGPPVSVMGLNFPNRLGLAAGMDKSAAAVDAWSKLGFGMVEVGTLTPRPQTGNPKPRLFRLPEHRALINRMGFNNPGIHSAVERLRHRQAKAVVGVNIGKNFDTPNETAVEDYLICLRATYDVADYVAVNISSPNTKGLRDLQSENAIRSLLIAVRAEQETLKGKTGRTVPVVVKIAPDLTGEGISDLVRVFNEVGVDGVIATNTTIDHHSVRPHKFADEIGGLSGEPVRKRSDEVLMAFRAGLRPEIPLIGVGGIVTGADAAEKRRLGADLVQIYSGLVFRGPILIKEATQMLVDRHGK
jgi:dihydroorotate dehydrogenase